MSITTYTSRADVQLIEDHEVNCPKCYHKMVVKDYYKQKKRGRGQHWLTSCTCLNGCLNLDPNPGESKEYFFVAYNVDDAHVVADRIKKKTGSC